MQEVYNIANSHTVCLTNKDTKCFLTIQINIMKGQIIIPLIKMSTFLLIQHLLLMKLSQLLQRVISFISI